MLCNRFQLIRSSLSSASVSRKSWPVNSSGSLLNFAVRKLTSSSIEEMSSEVRNVEKRHAADGEGGKGGGGGGGGGKGDLDAKKQKLITEVEAQHDQAAEEGVAAVDSSKTQPSTHTESKLKLKKYAMCLMYCGKGYLGLQRNPGMKTIEEDLLKACLDAKLITEDAYNNPQSIMFQRAARTDKGVSAARQVLSMKLPTQRGAPEQMKASINANLVDQIRVVGLKRVTRNFNSKNNADARTYSYILPTFAFAPSEEVADDKYRITTERVNQAESYLKLYLGSHNFHNFTAGKVSTDPSAMRYIKEIECGQPFLVGNLEYVQIRIKGQSFMLHQIRKMIGLVIAIMRGHTTEAIIKRAWGPEKLDLPKAPALGLMLEQVHYYRYDDRYGGDGTHETITWDEFQPEIHKFKHDFIYPNIWTTEENEESMVSWMSYLPLHSYDVREHEVRPELLDQNEDFLNDDGEDEENIDEKQQKAEEVV